MYLQNIKSGEMVKSWDIPLKEIFDDLQDLKRDLTAGFAERTIPVNVPAGSPTISVGSGEFTNHGGRFFAVVHHWFPGYLYKIDKDSRLVWKSEEMVHHSIELDEQGNIWTCSVNWGYPLAKTYKFREDAVLCLGADGKRLYFYSLSQILAENGLFEQLVAATPSFMQEYGPDPYHLNDVLPMKNGGRFWKRGDVFRVCVTRAL